MFKISYEDIVSKIITEKGLSKEEIDTKVDEKIRQLSDLVSREGAAHIIANQLGVKVFEDVSRKELKVNEVIPGLSSVNLNAKVINNFGVRNFDTGSRKGRVTNLVIGDETGIIRLVIWDEKLIDLIENELSIGDIIKVKGAYVRENSGMGELHLGSKAELEINPDGVEIGNIKETRLGTSFRRKKISDLSEGENAELFGVIVQVFEPRFYEACPECNKKISDGKCVEHGIVVSKEVPILNVFFDDGSGNLRAVFFRDLVSELFEVGDDQLLDVKNDVDLFEELKDKILGRHLLLSGRAIKNQMFDRIEFRVRSIKMPEPEQIIKELE